MKVLFRKLSPFILSAGLIVVWFVGLQFLYAETSEVLVRGIVFIFSTAFVIFILDYTIE